MLNTVAIALIILNESFFLMLEDIITLWSIPYLCVNPQATYLAYSLLIVLSELNL